MQSPNRILNSLPQNIFVAVEQHLKPISLRFGDVVAEPDQPVDKVYFPHTGVISLVVAMKVGDLIETAMVGRDGVVNATSSLDGKISLHKAIVQVAGAAAVVQSDALRALADEFGPLRGMLIRHEQVLFAQAQQSAGCNASHTVEACMLPLAAPDPRSHELGSIGSHAGISGADARRAAHQRLAGRRNPTEGRFDRIPPRSYSAAGHRETDDGRMRML